MKKTMYVLGQVCRAIWPGRAYNGSDVAPNSIIEKTLTHPASGLALMTKHEDNTADKQEAVCKLVGSIGDISDPPNGVAIEDQGQFWLGYYHYASAIDAQKKYGSAELEAAGKALFGDRWQTDLSNALGLSDARRMRQWMARERPIPVGVWADICALLRTRQMTINSLIQDLDNPD